MAFFQCDHRARSLGNLVGGRVAGGRMTHFNVILPEKCTDDIPVVFLLHGMNNDETSWMRFTNVERYATEQGMAIVMPNGAKSFYCDMKYGDRYAAYIGEELVEYVRRVFPVSKKREKTFIAGFSMGGYGAAKLALANSRTFGACAAMSGPLDIVGRLSGYERNGSAVAVWGEDYLSALSGSGDDTLELVRRLERSGEPKPWIFQGCGSDDPLVYISNQVFREFMRGRDFVHEYKEVPGGHDWEVMDRLVEAALDFFRRYMEQQA